LGSETLNRQIRRLRDRDDIDAIVLRIDSPGGSATASEAMWRELTLAAAEKPLIASMGELAASGGYYIAAPADTIVAEPTTITGSIGVFALLVSANGFFENKLGITSDAVLTSPYADMFSGLRPLSDAEEAVIARGIDRTYETFINRVAEGRGLSTDSVLAIAEGRVWSGSDAQAVGLVDVLGGIDVALDLAAERAGLAADAYRVEVFPKERPLFEQLEDAFQVKISERFQSPAERTLMRSLRRLNQIAESHGTIQMRMEFDVEVR
ncbi:MAG: signal peptide peptidase SppA, partial [Bacteroidota bacterium]